MESKDTKPSARVPPSQPKCAAATARFPIWLLPHALGLLGVYLGARGQMTSDGGWRLTDRTRGEPRHRRRSVATGDLSPNKPVCTAATMRYGPSSHALTRVPEMLEGCICPPAAWVAAPTARLINHGIGVVTHDSHGFAGAKNKGPPVRVQQAHVCDDLAPPERRSRGSGGARGHVPSDGAGGGPPTARVVNHDIGLGNLRLFAHSWS